MTPLRARKGRRGRTKIKAEITGRINQLNTGEFEEMVGYIGEVLGRERGELVGNSGGRCMTNQRALNNLGGCLSSSIGSQIATQHATWKKHETELSIVQDAL
ncbi:MAG: hypothetical protein GY820_29635 [Gammaproteobacteria bacterium]|nr:hypothetical protein [Gammaproteobacteria bacterium]